MISLFKLDRHICSETLISTAQTIKPLPYFFKYTSILGALRIISTDVVFIRLTLEWRGKLGGQKDSVLTDTVRQNRGK